MKKNKDSLESQSHQGRPTTVDAKALCTAELDVAQLSMIRHLHPLGKIIDGEVFHHLTEKQT